MPETISRKEFEEELGQTSIEPLTSRLIAQLQRCNDGKVNHNAGTARFYLEWVLLLKNRDKLPISTFDDYRTQKPLHYPILLDNLYKAFRAGACSLKLTTY